jgi:ubiquinone/menaquinone biosynthesis C-methylase UbiE
MPVDPSYLDRMLLKRNLAPQLLREVGGAGAFKAVALSSRLGVFEMLEGNLLTAPELAEKIKADGRGIRILLDFLVSTGYLNKRGERYTNSAQSSKWLARSSPVSLADMVLAWDSKVLKFWDLELERAIRTGRPSTDIFEWFNSEPDAWKLFNSFEMATARWIGPGIVKSVRLPSGSMNLLDIGGGHGVYSVLFCQRYPQLRAVVLDQPEPLRTASETIAKEELSSRISTRAWDLKKDPIEGGFDCALLLNILHNFDPDSNKELLAKVHGALNPSGIAVVWDNFKGPGRLLNTAFDFFGLAYLVGAGGQTYPSDTVASWLADGGFGRIRRYRTNPGLMTAEKVS